MEVPLPMLECLDKALLLKDCTNPRMRALHGRRDLPSMWISNVWRQMETMCSQVTCSALITQPISAKAGHLVIHPGTARLVAASSLIRSEAAQYSLATKWGCSFPRTAVHPGSLSMKVFRNARYLTLKHHAPIVVICLPVPRMRVSGESYLVQPQPQLPRLHLHGPQLQLQQ